MWFFNYLSLYTSLLQVAITVTFVSVLFSLGLPKQYQVNDNNTSYDEYDDDHDRSNIDVDDGSDDDCYDNDHHYGYCDNDYDDDDSINISYTLYSGYG